MRFPVSRATVSAQAKINLALRIKSKDSNDYHPLETLFLRLELADLVSIQVSTRERSILCGTDLGIAEDNLAFRAASAFARETGWPEGWVIKLEKHIPVGAGLGGGSADAGAVLRALNQMVSEPVPDARLLELAAGLGADVPFMTVDFPFAIGEGYGERLTPLPTPEQRTVGLLVPQFSINTAVAYAWLDESPARPADRPVWGSDLSWSELETLVENDFQPVVEQRHPEIADAVKHLRNEGASMAGMTGSGSVVFGVFPVASEPGRVTVPAGWELVWTRTAASVVEPQVMD